MQRTSLRSTVDGIDEDIVVVSTGFPHSITQQSIILDECALGFERLCVVVGNHDLGCFVVDVGLIASPLKQESHSCQGLRTVSLHESYR
jgi:hypothetical protein